MTCVARYSKIMQDPQAQKHHSHRSKRTFKKNMTICSHLDATVSVLPRKAARGCKTPKQGSREKIYLIEAIVTQQFQRTRKTQKHEHHINAAVPRTSWWLKFHCVHSLSMNGRPPHPPHLLLKKDPAFHQRQNTMLPQFLPVNPQTCKTA